MSVKSNADLNLIIMNMIRSNRLKRRFNHAADNLAKARCLDMEKLGNPAGISISIGSKNDAPIRKGVQLRPLSKHGDSSPQTRIL